MNLCTLEIGLSIRPIFSGKSYGDGLSSKKELLLEAAYLIEHLAVESEAKKFLLAIGAHMYEESE